MDVEVESAAVTAYEVGNPIDYRAQKILREAGYEVPRRGAYQITRTDIAAYDLVLPMTREHLRSLQRLAQAVPEGERAEIRLWSDFASDAAPLADVDVPDPWYGGDAGFQAVLTMIERTTERLVEQLPGLIRD